ncbi:MAG TPA: Rieske (2Fe-2S) protein [Labilithrix sp.]
MWVEAPIVVGRASDIAEPGAFFTHDGVGVPILVTRDHGGVVHAMVNVCRHRGTRLVSAERGSAELFVCPLHAWTYDLCGHFSLPMAPTSTMSTSSYARCDPRERRDDTMLVALPCAVRHGFVFVVPSPRARVQLEAMLGVLDDAVAPLMLDDRVVRERETRVTTWSAAREALARTDAVWMFPSSIVYADGDDVVHVCAQPLAGDDVELLTTILART